ncbi:hypothetical protein KDK_76520 [Dictyobacter kobayashii]|uniref:Uncharacterized protein n=1 Tax=Dictyobacter kobayashii TaxID=2014872 RepID=A0A402AXL2_9CHLR|nr:hypothetical protein KDK_76520 [Dictyobacter kobayashii]
MTIAFLIARRIKPVLGLCYILAQLAGGILGALMLSVVFPVRSGNLLNWVHLASPMV